MPSQRVVGAVTNLMHGGARFSYSLPGCTPQAYCRSEALLSHAMADMETWFPANGLSEMTGAGAASPAVSQNFQRPSEKTLSVNNVDDEVASAGITTAGLLSGYQADTWWPSINVHAKDHRSSQDDDKPASTFTSCSTESWCTTNPTVAVVANVDLNTPSCELPSAIAVMSIAPVSTKGGSSSRKDSKTKGKSFSAPTSPSELRKAKLNMRLGVQKAGKRPVSQRENHIWSERQRRKGMNYLFSTLRSHLPHPTSKTDKSTVVGEIIKYIQSLQVKLDILTKKRQHMLAARTLNNTFHGGDTTAPKAFVSNGLTLLDHSGDPSSMTAVTALPLPGSESGLQSYLGSNVGLHVCGLNVFITTSSPRGRSGLLQQLLVTIHKHDLDVINANISTSNASIFHYIHCQASPDEELLNNALHGDLQGMITNFEAPF